MKRQAEYIIEFVQNGAYVKVSAVDPYTGLEASIVGDARATEEHLARLAVRKLEKLLASGRK